MRIFAIHVEDVAKIDRLFVRVFNYLRNFDATISAVISEIDTYS